MYEKEYSQELMNACAVKNPLENLDEYLSRLKFVKEESQKESFKKLAEAAKRVLRITKDTDFAHTNEALFVLDEEKELYHAVNAQNADSDDLGAYVKSLENLGEPIDKFFDKVLVMDKDEKIKNNRIALLNTLKEKFSKVCNFQYL